jgi:hypothetical protein
LDHWLFGAGREAEDGVEAGCDAGDVDVGGVLGEGVDEGVPAAAVAQAGGADVAVVGAGGDELSEGGRTIQARRRPGARDLLAVPR